MAGQWLVALDFAARPKRTFSKVLAEEFGAEVERVQKSVVMCRDDFTARRLCALLERYGANICAFAVNGKRSDDTSGNREAEAFVERVHTARRARQGKRG